MAVKYKFLCIAILLFSIAIGTNFVIKDAHADVASDFQKNKPTMVNTDTDEENVQDNKLSDNSEKWTSKYIEYVPTTDSASYWSDVNFQISIPKNDNAYFYTSSVDIYQDGTADVTKKFKVTSTNAGDGTTTVTYTPDKSFISSSDFYGHSYVIQNYFHASQTNTKDDLLKVSGTAYFKNDTDEYDFSSNEATTLIPGMTLIHYIDQDGNKIKDDVVIKDPTSKSTDFWRNETAPFSGPRDAVIQKGIVNYYYDSELTYINNSNFRIQSFSDLTFSSGSYPVIGPKTTELTYVYRRPQKLTVHFVNQFGEKILADVVPVAMAWQGGGAGQVTFNFDESDSSEIFAQLNSDYSTSKGNERDGAVNGTGLNYTDIWIPSQDGQKTWTESSPYLRVTSARTAAGQALAGYKFLPDSSFIDYPPRNQFTSNIRVNGVSAAYMENIPMYKNRNEVDDVNNYGIPGYGDATLARDKEITLVYKKPSKVHYFDQDGTEYFPKQGNANWASLGIDFNSYTVDWYRANTSDRTNTAMFNGYLDKTDDSSIQEPMQISSMLTKLKNNSLNFNWSSPSSSVNNQSLPIPDWNDLVNIVPLAINEVYRKAQKLTVHYVDSDGKSIANDITNSWYPILGFYGTSDFDNSRESTRNYSLPVSSSNYMLMKNSKLFYNVNKDIDGYVLQNPDTADVALGMDYLNDDKAVLMKDKEVTLVYDKAPKGDVLVTKHGVGGEVLAGTEFSLKDKAGNLVSIGKTDANGEHIFKDLLAGDYSLTETGAPDGYNIMNKKPVDFTVVASKQQTVSFVDDAKTELPDTGTNSRILLASQGLFTILLAIGGMLLSVKMRKTEELGN
ncbi:hypothetical protein EQG49_00155 [Periweissella cryptocerci]|uniref:LPXTG cell wall anchor domain-containing protein n=1 Tax=Periweissella cryptocerci TaxID=2506420 RepID=A0A4P6YQV2_9LACO|nr:SpaA isopeptide-forming pilin-related protein [Periweissella cryptocerci]QBO34966.1 hypothetical protein EQG49_00155 [Periweissella cryptocerci]